VLLQQRQGSAVGLQVLEVLAAAAGSSSSRPCMMRLRNCLMTWASLHLHLGLLAGWLGEAGSENGEVGLIVSLISAQQVSPATQAGQPRSSCVSWIRQT
jgi:hypothetical protein